MKDFKKYYVITATPDEVYLALTVEATIMLWTADKANMQALEGSEFSLWDGSIQGKNLELVPGKKIVQQWYFGDQEPPSIVTIKLHVHKQGTSAELTHTNIPAADYNDFVDGWDNSYFGAIQDFYNEDD
jgi:uncharacterized protein YndB with AHSA1/START domain